MKLGRNDPCPCGSGKKYKKCCLNKPSQVHKFKHDISIVYAGIKNINSQLIKKSNALPYASASFTDAMDLAITSNALSLIKGFLHDNYYSITNALNIRNIIEHYVFILMDNAGDISDVQKELFNEQYKLIEYRCYNKNDLGDNGVSIDREQMKENYDTACAFFKAKGFNSSKVKNFSETRAPFLCQDNFNFNEIIKKYLPDYLDAYIYLSRYIHPSTYYQFRIDKYYTDIALSIFMLLVDRYSRFKISDETSLPFYQESVLVYGPESAPTVGQFLYDIQHRQWEILLEIADYYAGKFKPDNYVSNFLKEAALIVHDINTDSQLGYTENPKLKFKVIAEMFACFDRTYFDVVRGQSLYMLMDAHEVFKWHEMMGTEAPQDVVNTAFGYYMEAYPESKISKEVFYDTFKLGSGFLIDEQGKKTSLLNLVFSYFESIIEVELKLPYGSSLLNLYKILYLESQSMSHGCGYLYFANQGAWMEDVNILSFLDLALGNILNKMVAMWKTSELFGEDETEFVKFLESKRDEMDRLISAKAKTFKAVPRVNNVF